MSVSRRPGKYAVKCPTQGLLSGANICSSDIHQILEMSFVGAQPATRGPDR